MGIVDLFIRFSACGLYAGIVLLALRDARHVTPARWGALLAFNSICVLLVEMPVAYTMPFWIEFVILALMAFNSMLIIWWFCRSLFQDDFRLGWIDLGVATLWIGLSVPPLWGYMNGKPFIFDNYTLIRNIISLGILGHILYVALAQRSDDLVESRRRVRLGFTLAIVAFSGESIIAEMIYGSNSIPEILKMTKAITYLVIAIASLIWIAQIRAGVFSFDRPMAPAPKPERPDLNPRERQTLGKLSDIMDEQTAWMEPGLSIGSLATKVGVPEHQLRALINKSLGFRNFSAYLNSYRIEAAKRSLSAPENLSLPVLTIAMDVGYGSLAPFNRAFKTVVGQTPTEYRQMMMEKAAKSPIASEKA